MSANCSYLYTTDGSRWEGGSIAVTMLDDKTTRVGPDDISRLRKEFGRKAVIRVFCVTKDGERIPMQLDLARAKGRAGRREKKLDGTYGERLRAAGYTDERTVSILKEQLRTLPYGEKNADAAIERMKVALEVLEHGTVARMLSSLEAPHLIVMLARACATGTYSLPTPLPRRLLRSQWSQQSRRARHTLLAAPGAGDVGLWRNPPRALGTRTRPRRGHPCGAEHRAASPRSGGRSVR